MTIRAPGATDPRVVGRTPLARVLPATTAQAPPVDGLWPSASPAWRLGRGAMSPGKCDSPSVWRSPRRITQSGPPSPRRGPSTSCRKWGTRCSRDPIASRTASVRKRPVGSSRLLPSRSARAPMSCGQISPARRHQPVFRGQPVYRHARLLWQQLPGRAGDSVTVLATTGVWRTSGGPAVPARRPAGPARRNPAATIPLSRQDARVRGGASMASGVRRPSTTSAGLARWPVRRHRAATTTRPVAGIRAGAVLGAVHRSSRTVHGAIGLEPAACTITGVR
jgi:hypothetical protein